MNLQTLQQQTKTLVGDAKLGTAFELLKKHVAPHSSRYNDLMIIKSNHADVSNAGMVGTLTYEYLQTGKNQIAHKIISYVDVLEEEDVRNPVAAEQHKDFLVICPTAQMPKMKEYFTSLQFSGFEVCSYEAVLDIAPYKLLVFYNMDLPHCPQEAGKQELDTAIQQNIEARIQFMETCLSTKQYAVYYGNNFYWVNDRRDYIHPANSRFALFARVREMLQFWDALGG